VGGESGTKEGCFCEKRGIKKKNTEGKGASGKKDGILHQALKKDKGSHRKEELGPWCKRETTQKRQGARGGRSNIGPGRWVSKVQKEEEHENTHPHKEEKRVKGKKRGEFRQRLRTELRSQKKKTGKRGERKQCLNTTGEG